MEVEEAIKRCQEVFSTYNPKFVEEIVRVCEGHNVPYINAFVYGVLPRIPVYTKGFWIGALYTLIGGNKSTGHMRYCEKCGEITPCRVVDGKIVCIVCETRKLNEKNAR